MARLFEVILEIMHGPVRTRLETPFLDFLPLKRANTDRAEKMAAHCTPRIIVQIWVMVTRLEVRALATLELNTDTDRVTHGTSVDSPSIMIDRPSHRREAGRDGLWVAS